ncbi:MAG: DUF4384 domain-containing protein [Gammaproteobacteria bacterium]
MKTEARQIDPIFRWTTILALCFGLLSACSLNPHQVDVTLKEGTPAQKTTDFDKALRDLGLMSQIYSANKINVMSQFISDNTGTSVATQSEIPRDVTEMVKTALNSIGGNITYIPYDPDFILNSAQTGYSGFQKKLIPHIVVTGGITEFDRGLETRGKNTDIGLEGTAEGNEIGFDFSDKSKTSVASITLDFNMVDFEKLSGIPRIQSVNNIKVGKAVAENSIAFSIIGNTIGLKGSVKKVQGRHAAVRLLVQVSMIELMGKYLNLPYWRLLGSEPDPVVLDSLKEKFYAMNEKQRVEMVQQLLILNGYEIPLTGDMDAQTKGALAEFGSEHSLVSPSVDEDTYLSLYGSVPITHKVLHKRKLMASLRNNVGKTGTPVNSLVSKDGLLRISTNETTFNIGDPVNISLEVTKPLYVQVLNVSSTGKVWHLFPENEKSRVLLNPGKNYQIPSDDAPYELEIVGPAGTDQIIAFASPKPLPDSIRKINHKDEISDEILASVPIRVNTLIKIK